MSTPQKLMYTISEAAQAVGLSEKTIRRAIDAGLLPVYYPTRRAAILPADLLTWATTDRKSA
jgi:excisionase family DNA binding protein